MLLGNNLDFNKNQALLLVLQNLASAPSSPVAGQIYFNTSLQRIFYWDATASAWIGPDDIDVDNVTIEISSGQIRIKDLGVSTAKLANDAVTTIKVADNVITFAKMQDIGTMKVIGRVSAGTGDPQEVSILNETDLISDSATAIPTQHSVKIYVDNAIANIGQFIGGFAAGSATDFPTAPGGTNRGDYWRVTSAGTVRGEVLAVGDVIIANIDSPTVTTNTDWTKIQANVDQATTTVLGLVRLATSAETLAGTDADKAVTPAGLAAMTATETQTGHLEVATQAEANAGVLDTKIITPAKLVAWWNQTIGGYAADIGDGSATSFAVTHSLNTKDVLVEVVRNSNGATIITDVVRNTVNQVTVDFSTAPTSNQYRVLITRR